MTTKHAGPPSLAARWLASALQADERDELMGDLEEQFQHRVASRGVAAARRWYWRQTLALIWGFNMRRRDVISIEHQRLRGRWALDLLQTDLRHAWRSLVHAKSFAITAFLTLTLGIGISTAVFSLVHAVLIAPLPYPHADRLVRLSEQRPEGLMKNDEGVMSDVGIGAWASQPTSLAVIAPYGTFEGSIIVPGGTQDAWVADTSRDFFALTSTPALAGRPLLPTDLAAGAPLTAVISARLAQQAFNGPQAAVGQSVGIDTHMYLIVGVMPSTFAFPEADVDVWRMGSQFRRFPSPGETRNLFFRTEVLGLLREGATVADAVADGRRVAAGLQAASDTGDAPPVRATFHVRGLLAEMVAPVRTALLILSAGTFIVLAAAGISLANLLIARTTARQRETAVRLALGAGRWRVGRPVLLELLILAGAGGLGSGLLAAALLHVLPAIAPASLPRIESIHFDFRTIGVAVIASVGTALLSGWWPLSRLARVGLREISNEGGRVRFGPLSGSGDRIRSALAAGQVALSAMLVVGALLIGRSLSAQLHVDLGYQPGGVLGFQAAQPLMVMSRDQGRLTRYYHALLDRLAAGPSVVSVGQASILPMHSGGGQSGLHIVGRPVEPIASPEDLVLGQYISADYLRTIGIPVVSGRGFTAADTPATESVALIDETLARRYFPAGDAIGHQLLHGRTTSTIVGVVGAVRYGAPSAPAKAALYYPIEQSSEYLALMRTAVVVRTTGDPASLTGFVRTAAHDVDPSVQLFNVRPLTDDIGLKVAGPRFFTLLLTLFAALALSTVLLGIYGVLAYAVERRRVEFGIRRALGATEQHVTALVLGRAARFAGAGLASGIVLAWIGARWLRAELFGVTPADPVSFACAAILVAAIVLAASWQPVRRALRIDPARALRVD